jgi:hypothetical protein
MKQFSASWPRRRPLDRDQLPVHRPAGVMPQNYAFLRRCRRASTAMMEVASRHVYFPALLSASTHMSGRSCRESRGAQSASCCGVPVRRSAERGQHVPANRFRFAGAGAGAGPGVARPGDSSCCGLGPVTRCPSAAPDGPRSCHADSAAPQCCLRRVRGDQASPVSLRLLS